MANPNNNPNPNSNPNPNPNPNQGARSIKLDDSLIPLERRFCFYDQVHTTGPNPNPNPSPSPNPNPNPNPNQVHTTGTDVKHVPNAVAVLTLGKDMNFRDYAQGAYRMRGIATGQRINVLVVPEIEKVMHRELDALGSEGNAEFERMGPDKRLLEGVACWLISNSLETECKACNFLMQQDLASLCDGTRLEPANATSRKLAVKHAHRLALPVCMPVCAPERAFAPCPVRPPPLPQVPPAAHQARGLRQGPPVR